MTSIKQLEANRHNALKSTGPKTEIGKRQSRRNAIRHGFTAETVLEPLENSGSTGPSRMPSSRSICRTPVEHELVHRLASVFWRLRRATSIEIGLLRMQGSGALVRTQQRLQAARGPPPTPSSLRMLPPAQTESR